MPRSPDPTDRTWMPDDAGAPPLAPGDVSERYARLTLLGQGGMGEVWEVHDRVLDRVVAMKLATGAASPAALQRFLREAQATSRLQHPGVVPVHDYGRLDDGRAFFTMKVVRGTTLRAFLADQPLRRVIGVLVRVCEALGYAHAQGVVHRDLKPDNVMIGAFGEVLVVDWGLAHLLDARPEDASGSLDRDGQIVGSPRYMAPEQAVGALDAIGPPVDVWALGAILHLVLTGSQLWPGAAAEVIAALVRDPVPPLPDDPAIQPGLRAIRDRCLQRDPAARFADATAVGEALLAWLDGAERREAGLRLVARADEQEANAARLTDEAAALRAEAAQQGVGIARYAPAEEKAGLWAIEAAADAKAAAADLARVSAHQDLHAALRQDPELPEAHARLAAHHRAGLEAAERDGDAKAAARHELLLRAHDRARVHASFLDGAGHLVLHTDVPATATLLRYVEHDRRLRAVPEADLGPTPIDRPLPRGSWLVELTAPGRAPVRYPVGLGREQRWDPGRPLRLPRADQVGPEDCFVPEGPFVAGGDRGAPEGAPRAEVWVDSFVIRRFQVTNEAYIAFLDDLVARGDEAAALRYVPRADTGAEGGDGLPIFGRTPDGRFTLVPDAQGDVWLPQHPVMMIDWDAARAYAAWEAARTGLPWRLPLALEWEKAARGTDARIFPWGNGFDPSFCRMKDSNPGRGLPVEVDTYPDDVSPYGVRGMAGNVRDWCLDGTSPDDLLPSGARLDVAAVLAAARPTRVHTRGGYFFGSERLCRAAFRHWNHTEARAGLLGFRLARSV